MTGGKSTSNEIENIVLFTNSIWMIKEMNDHPNENKFSFRLISTIA